MAKLTVLQYVQDILNDLDSDEVNSINDTLEATQIAQIVQTTFFEIITEGDWPHLRQLMQLDSSADATKPNYMKMPENVQRLEQVQYNKRLTTDTKDKYEEVKYKTPEQFLELTRTRNSSDADVTTVTDFTNVVLYILNDTPPLYWTSFDDEYVVFDAYELIDKN